MCPRVQAQTRVGGLICGDTIWGLAGSPYVVDTSILVACDSTLTIEPGVELRFEPGLGLTVGHVTFGRGTLVAQGSAGAPTNPARSSST